MVYNHLSKWSLIYIPFWRPILWPEVNELELTHLSNLIYR
jgi:hypothetical protein